MGAPLSSGIGTGAAQVYSGTMAYDALRDIIQQQRIQREKKEVKQEKRQLKAEKEQKELEAFQYNELSGIISPDANILEIRDGAELRNEIWPEAKEILNRPGFAERLKKGDIDAMSEWNSFKQRATSKINKSVEDKAALKEHKGALKTWQEGGGTGNYYEQDLQLLDKASKEYGSDIPTLIERIDGVDNLYEGHLAQSLQQWKAELTEEQKGRTTGKGAMKKEEAERIVDNFLSEPKYKRAIADNLGLNPNDMSSDQIKTAMDAWRQDQINRVMQWKDVTTTAASGSNNYTRDKDLVKVANKNEWMTQVWDTPLTSDYINYDTMDDFVDLGLVIPMHWSVADVEAYPDGLMTLTDGTTRDVVAGEPKFKKSGKMIFTSLPDTKYEEVGRQGKILKKDAQFEQMEEALRSTGKYRSAQYIFPFEKNGVRGIGVIPNLKSAFEFIDPRTKRQTIYQSPYVKNFTPVPGGGSFDPNAY